MNRKLTAVLLILCLAFALTITGCGGTNGGSSNGGDTGSTAAEYVEPYNYDLTEYMILDKYTGLEISYDKKAALGDKVNIDYTGRINGEKFEGGYTDPAEGGVDFTIGSGMFLEDLEYGVVGHEAGETFNVDVTFPDYYSEDLKGKTATFEVVLNSVDKVNAINEAVLSALEENTEILKYPQKELTEYQSGMHAYYESMAENQGMSFKEFAESQFGGSEAAFEEYIRYTAEKQVGREMIAFYIAHKEGFEITDEEYDANVLKYLQDFGYYDHKSFESMYGMSFEEAYGKETIVIRMTTEKVIDFVLNNSTVL